MNYSYFKSIGFEILIENRRLILKKKTQISETIKGVLIFMILPVIYFADYKLSGVLNPGIYLIILLTIFVFILIYSNSKNIFEMNENKVTIVCDYWSLAKKEISLKDINSINVDLIPKYNNKNLTKLVIYVHTVSTVYTTDFSSMKLEGNSEKWEIHTISCCLNDFLIHLKNSDSNL